RVWSLGADLAAGLRATAIGQADVHDDHIGLTAPGLGDRFGPAASFADDAEPRYGPEQASQAQTHHGMIVHQQQAHLRLVHALIPGAATGSSTRTSVPRPGSLTSTRRPPSALARSVMLLRPWPDR